MAGNITLTQPSLKGVKVPNGHVVLNSKYHGNTLEKAITECGLRLMYEDTIGLIDCYPSSHCAIVVFQECHLFNSLESKQKIRKLEKFPHHKIILLEKTETSNQNFKDLQQELVLSDSKIQLIPFSTLKDVGLLLKQMNQLESGNNPFLVKNKAEAPHENAMVAFVTTFPGIGEKKAVELLKKYKSIQELSKANCEDLTKIVGQASAKVIQNTFKS